MRNNTDQQNTSTLKIGNKQKYTINEQNWLYFCLKIHNMNHLGVGTYYLCIVGASIYLITVCISNNLCLNKISLIIT